MRSARTFLWLPVFWCITAFLYRHCAHAHLLDDFIAGIYAYMLQGSAGFLNSFGIPSLYYGHNFFFYGFYLLVGLNDYAWHLLFVSLHAVNAWLFYRCASAVLKRCDFVKAEQAAVVAALFFVCGQHQSENVVWAATLHYQISMLFMWLGCLVIIHRSSVATLLLLLFSASVVTQEISLVFPGIWAVLHRLLYKNSMATIRQVVLPMLFAIVVYFIATYLLKGVWVPHYGEEHLRDWSLLQVMGTYFKYLLKIFAFVHFLDFPVREKIYHLFDRADVVAAASLLLTAFGWLLFKTGNRKLVLALALLWVLSLIALLPVLNMYFMFLNRVENDRLSYLATPFLYLALALVLTRFSVWCWLPITVALLFAMKHFLGLYCWYWIQAAEIQQRTLSSFHFESARKVFTLNLPQNYGGAYIYRKPWRFEAALLVIKGQEMKGRIHNVAGQNLFREGDGVLVEQQDLLTLKVTNAGWGWFWRDMQGAADYETDDFVFDLCDGYYLVHFRHPPRQPDAVVIYQQDGIWKEWIWK